MEWDDDANIEKSGFTFKIFILAFYCPFLDSLWYCVRLIKLNMVFEQTRFYLIFNCTEKFLKI